MKTATVPLSEARFRSRVEATLRRLERPVTLGDVVAHAGLRAGQTENLLFTLLDAYRGRLAVDAQGHLFDAFPHRLQRPGPGRRRAGRSPDGPWRRAAVS